jgi:hypothetical protein
MHQVPFHLASAAAAFATLILIMVCGIAVLIALLRRMLGKPPRVHYRGEQVTICTLICRDGIIFADDWSLKDHLLLPDLNEQLAVSVSRRFAKQITEIVEVRLSKGHDQAARFRRHGEFVVDSGLVFIISAHLRTDPAALKQFKKMFQEANPSLDEVWLMKSSNDQVVGLVFHPVYGDGAYPVLLRRDQSALEIKCHFA